MKKQEQDAILNNNSNFENVMKAKGEPSLEARVAALETAHAELVNVLSDAVKHGKQSGQLSLSALAKALEVLTAE
jgi:hypothetical protein